MARDLMAPDTHVENMIIHNLKVAIIEDIKKKFKNKRKKKKGLK